MYISNLIKRKNESRSLDKLRNIQQRISKLEKVTSLPVLGYYVASTTIFFEDKDALKYIFDVINGKEDPTKLPQHSPFKIGCPIYFGKLLLNIFMNWLNIAEIKIKKKLN